MNEMPRTDRVTRMFQAAVLALLAMSTAALWDGRAAILPHAVAQIPDTALQRQQIVDQLKVTNELLNRIANHLETKTIKVRTVDTDENEGKTAPSGVKAPFGGRKTG